MMPHGPAFFHHRLPHPVVHGGGLLTEDAGTSAEKMQIEQFYISKCPMAERTVGEHFSSPDSRTSRAGSDEGGPEIRPSGATGHEDSFIGEERKMGLPGTNLMAPGRSKPRSAS
jgi:hypothetical protein